MRIFSFCRKWGKLNLDLPIEQRSDFTSFRFVRKDKDWQEGERVQVYFKSRSPQREHLGIAEIVEKLPKAIKEISEFEAVADGFNNACEMWIFLDKPSFSKMINKLTLRWVAR